MKRFFLLGAAVGVLSAGPEIALTMTPTGDNRGISASAEVTFDSSSDSDSPGAGFPTFDSDVSAFASDQFDPDSAGDALTGIYGSLAGAYAQQYSQVGPLSITGSGSASAGGGFGDTLDDDSAGGGGGCGGCGDEYFESDASSVLEILFSIDESAMFNLSGFLSAGEQIFSRGLESGVNNRASIILVNTDTLESAYKADVSNDSLIVDESGVIGPGNYKFNVEAIASIFNDGVFNLPAFVGDAEGIPIDGIETGASFEGVALTLRSTDKPIPEPMTTTLACMGLGALVLKTSRRRAS